MIKKSTEQESKLVRDNIPDVIAAAGRGCRWHIANDSEYRKRLAEKLIEEAEEYRAEPCLEELADLLEVLEAAAASHGSNLVEVQRIQVEKKAARGGFQKRIILEQWDTD